MSLGVGFDKFFDFLFSFIAFFGGQVDSRLERGFWENILSFSAADLVEDLDAFRPIHTSRLFARLHVCHIVLDTISYLHCHLCAALSPPFALSAAFCHHISFVYTCPRLPINW
jgi:hypothetical protein